MCKILKNTRFYLARIFSEYMNIRVANSIFLPEEYSEPNQTSKMELFAKIASDLKLLTIFVKNSILNVLLDSEYTSACVLSI